jgi:hypothetical protein
MSFHIFIDNAPLYLMYKKLITILTVLIVWNCYSQDPNPDLFQTWHLYSFVDLEGITQVVHDVPLEVDPEFVIGSMTDIIPFTGIICEEYGGHFRYSSSDDTLLLEIFDICLCGNCIDPDPLVVDFEFSYYDVFFNFTASHFDYEIVTNQPTGFQHLLLYPSPGITISYYNVEPFLGVNETLLDNRISLYPNPATDQLFITADIGAFENCTMYTASGQKVMEVFICENSVTVSGLTKGLYFLEFTSSEGKTIKRFIKK